MENEKDRYVVRKAEVVDDLVWIEDLGAQTATGDFAVADAPLDRPMDEDLAEAITAVVNAAHLRPGGFLSEFVGSVLAAVRSLERLEGLRPIEALELFREKPGDLLELSILCESAGRQLKSAANAKAVLQTEITKQLTRAGA